MLVVSRKKDESIVIDGGRIKVLVVAIDGDKVKLGVEAPRDVTINRGEIQERIDSQVIAPGDAVNVSIDGDIRTIRVTDVSVDQVVGLWERRPGEHLVIRAPLSGARLIAKGGAS